MSVRWISKRAVLAIHSEQIAEHGGADGIRDEALLDSALARPRNFEAYESPSNFDLAASYAFGIVRNHPFVDGNKRTGLIASATFLLLNGYELNAPENEAVDLFFRLADGKVSEKELAKWFAENCVQIH